MELLLTKNEIVELGTNLKGVRLTCHCGCCWVTQAGDSRDIILRAGQGHTIYSRGKVIVNAATAARLYLQTEQTLQPMTFFRLNGLSPKRD